MSLFKKRRINTKFIFKILLIIIFIYLLLRAFPSPTGSDYRTFLPEDTIHYNSFKTSGVIIKDERIYYATDRGAVETFIDEGERVSSGSKVAVLTRSGDSASLEEELSQINKSISDLKSIQSESENGDVSKSDIVINLKDQIQNEIRAGNYDRVYLLKEKILNLNDGSNHDKSKSRLAQLEEKRKKLSKQIDESIKNYYLEDAAIVSYKIDGFEEKYQPKDYEKYSYNSIKEDLKKAEEDKTPIATVDKETYSIDNPIFKAIDNFKWNLAIKVDDLKKIKDLENRKTLKVQLLNINEELEGKIIGINRFKDSGVIILEFRSKLHEFYNERFIELNVVDSTVKGYKIPKSSTLEKDSSLGVYIKDSSNIVRFRPIVVVGEDEHNYYVNKGDENGYIKMEGKEAIRSIALFEEIFINPKKVKEGKIMK